MGDAAVHQFNNIKLGAKGTKVGAHWVCPWLACIVARANDSRYRVCRAPAPSSYRAMVSAGKRMLSMRVRAEGPSVCRRKACGQPRLSTPPLPSPPVRPGLQFTRRLWRDPSPIKHGATQSTHTAEHRASDALLTVTLQTSTASHGRSSRRAAPSVYGSPRARHWPSSASETR